MHANFNPINQTSDILIVDDEIPNLQLLTQLLSDAGYQSLRSARQPQMAIESALAKPPSLILLDVRMPEINGFEVCRRLKQKVQTREIPIIFVSALHDVQDRVQGFEAGGVDFITKPFQKLEILARVRTHLGLYHMQRHLEELVLKRTADLAAMNRELEAEIIERQKVENTLARSEKRFRALFEKANDGIIALEGNRITECNQRALDILDRAPEEILGRRPSDISPPRQPGGQLSKELEQKYIERAYDGDALIFEWVHTRGDGAFADLEVSMNRIDVDNRTTFLVLWRDITQRKKLEAERQQANRELKHAYDEIQRLKERLEADNLTLRQEIRIATKDNEFVGKSHLARTLIRQVEQVAPTDATVLILGETGTGKGLIARKIHQRSKRQDRPLVNVNCAALPATLIEDEFFGHEKGAFTGAIETKIGRFELADGGTIFLDEIGDLPIALQSKLLRVLQEKEFERLGSTQTKTVDTRIIAATNRDLDTLVEQGAFRADLFYRLGVFPIRIPPLRERRSDIPLLVWFYITMLQPRIGKRFEAISSKVMDSLIAYDWPGNVRELRNLIERAMILCPGTQLELEVNLPSAPSARHASAPNRAPQRETLEAIERAHIVRVLEACGWKTSGKGGAAERLGLKRTTLQSRMKKLDIRRPVPSP